MSKTQTGLIKILILILILGLTNNFVGCAQSTSQLYLNATPTSSKQDILNGSEVFEQNPISKKVLFLSLGAKLLKTPSGGHVATETGLCTASAITPQIILTAAHCVKALSPADDPTPDTVFVILGLKPWKSKFDVDLWYAAEKIIAHPSYKKKPTGGLADDLALIKLKRALPAEYVTELASTKDLQSTMEITMAGFGLRSNLHDLSPEDTKKNLGELFQISKMISNYDINNLTIEIDQHNEKGICSGDSGGPGFIVNPTTKKLMTIGVVSGLKWDVNDKKKLDPENKLDCFGFAVYTNIMNPAYYDWIQKTAQELK